MAEGVYYSIIHQTEDSSSRLRFDTGYSQNFDGVASVGGTLIHEIRRPSLTDRNNRKQTAVGGRIRMQRDRS